MFQKTPQIKTLIFIYITQLDGGYATARKKNLSFVSIMTKNFNHRSQPSPRFCMDNCERLKENLLHV